jgi:hypothetical protein
MLVPWNRRDRGLVSGGLKHGHGFTYVDNFYLGTTFDLEKLAGWRGAQFAISGINRSGPPSPEGPHEREARQARPLRAQVDPGQPGGLMIEEERRIADQQRRVVALDARGRVGRHRLEHRVDPPRFPAEDAREPGGRPRARVQADPAHLGQRHARKERDGCDVAVRDDSKVGHDLVRLLAAQVFDRRDHAEIDPALVQQPRALRGDVVAKLKTLRLILQPVDQRPRIQVANRTQPDHLDLEICEFGNVEIYRGAHAAFRS